MRETVNRVQDAVALWLNSQYESVEVNERYFPDLIAYKGGKRFGFEVKYFSNPNMAGHTLRDMIYRAYYELKEGRVDELTVVYAVQNSDDIDLWRRALSRSSRDETPDNIWVVIWSN